MWWSTCLPPSHSLSHPTLSKSTEEMVFKAVRPSVLCTSEPTITKAFHEERVGSKSEYHCVPSAQLFQNCLLKSLSTQIMLLLYLFHQNYCPIKSVTCFFSCLLPFSVALSGSRVHSTLNHREMLKPSDRCCPSKGKWTGAMCQEESSCWGKLSLSPFLQRDTRALLNSPMALLLRIPGHFL